MSVTPALILWLTAGALAVAVLGLMQFLAGWERRRVLAERSVTGDRLLGRGPREAFERWLRGTEAGRVVERRLTASGVRMSVLTFLTLLTLSTGAVLVLIGAYLAPLFGVAAGVGVALAFFGFLRRREDRRREEFIAQLPELARVLSNASSAGLVLRTAIEMAAEELEDPARSELRITSAALRIGKPIDETLHELGERLPSRELAVLVSTLLVAARSGGSLVTALQGIATTLDERKETRREIRTILGEAVVSNWAVGVLGIGALLLINLIQPGVLREMAGSTVGQAMLGVSLTLFVTGLVVIRRITRIDL
ncbi:type II secretion system F family protein [Actinomadura luteofluorescens]|uniref:type II secretion system F family protein n=1 Tax=Actinomadura luteofluorescens TaxID=46163 RepID=UPI00348361F6